VYVYVYAFVYVECICVCVCVYSIVLLPTLVCSVSMCIVSRTCLLTAVFVLGSQGEEMLKQKNNNAEFAFLFPGRSPLHVYYKWKLYCTQCNIPDGECICE